MYQRRALDTFELLYIKVTRSNAKYLDYLLMKTQRWSINNLKVTEPILLTDLLVSEADKGNTENLIIQEKVVARTRILKLKSI